MENENNEVNSTPIGDNTEDQVTWYIQSGTFKGTSVQINNVKGLFTGLRELLAKQPWGTLGAFVYGSKRGFESDNPYLIPTMLMSTILSENESNGDDEFGGLNLGDIPDLPIM